MNKKINESERLKAERLAKIEAERLAAIEAERLAKIEAERLKAERIDFVKMKNDKGIVANVHPNEVENYKKGNYVKV